MITSMSARMYVKQFSMQPIQGQSGGKVNILEGDIVSVTVRKKII